MNLCIDQGNSSTKIGIFNEDSLVETIVFEQLNTANIESLFARHALKACILSSVTGEYDDVLRYLSEKKVSVTLLTHTTPLPFVNRYETLETLGKDRVAAVAGAAFLQPETDLLVIDAGTAITYDFIDAAGNYHGGNIAPGLDMRFRALHEFTRKLPLADLNTEVSLLGKNTASALQAGVFHGTIFEVDGYIDQLKLKYPKLLTFLTGGSTIYLVTKLKSAIFAERNLVLIGLNRILLFNVQK